VPELSLKHALLIVTLRLSEFKCIILSFPGKQEAVDTVLMALQVVPEPLKGFATILVEVCAYAGKLEFGELLIILFDLVASCRLQTADCCHDIRLFCVWT